MAARIVALALLSAAATSSAKKSAKKTSKKSSGGNQYSTKNESISGTPWRRKGGVLEEISPGRMVLFGGKVKDPRANRGKAAYAGDAWLLTLSHPDPGGATWTPLSGSEPAGAVAPLARWKACGAGIDGAFYLFGGGSEVGRKNVYFDDLWRLDIRGGVAWTRIDRARALLWPEPRRGAWAAPIDGGMVVAGGRTKGHTCFRDAWTYRAATSTWSKSGSMPDIHEYPCRWGHTLTRIPPVRGTSPFPDGRSVETVAVFGGRFLPMPGDVPDMDDKEWRKFADEAFVYLNDLWFYDPREDEWALAEVLGKEQPAKRDHHAAAYVAGGFFIHGGKLTDQAPKALSDLWRYDLASKTWTEYKPADHPSSRFLHDLAAWPNAPNVNQLGGAGQAMGAVVLFGGEHIKSRDKNKKGIPKKKYDRMNDVWMFSTITGNWTELIPDAPSSTYNLAETPYLPLVAEFFGALIVAVLLTISVLHARFQADDGGPPGVI